MTTSTPTHTPSTSSPRSPDPRGTDRRALILSAAIDSFGDRGYYGTSLQRIATQCGLTKAGLIHHIGSKQGLLEMVLRDAYDGQTDPVTHSEMRRDDPLIPEVMRKIVAVNATRPRLVHMFSTLSTEALDPGHPAHDYFVRREKEGVDAFLDVGWRVPAGTNVKATIECAWSAMDGIQIRWLRAPEQDLNAMWALCEDALFPLPVWKGYR